MSWYVGIDTSNYTSSAAAYNSATGAVVQHKKLLPVAQGRMGLKQSDAVFLHVRQLWEVLERVLGELTGPPAAVAASGTPRDEEGSYMPCFLVGVLAARACAGGAGARHHSFSHQAGHVMAALYSADRLELAGAPLLAFHFSGGTTQCLLVEPDARQIVRITTLAQTLDLNAGQAVDRVGGLLGLPFPAGPRLEELAKQSRRSFRPRPAFKGPDCCLSGVENQCAAMLAQGAPGPEAARYCLDYLSAAALEMTARVLERHPGLPLVYAGGVMSNSLIREAVLSRYPGAHFAQPQYSCDNAVGTALLCAMKEGDR